MKRSSAGAALTDLILEVFRLNGRLLAAGDQLTSPMGQTSARWQVLGSIGDASRSVSEIARAMGLTRQSVQRTADLLQAEHLVSYTENPRHQRAKLVTLTARGRSVLDWITRQQIAWINELTSNLGEAEVRRALNVIRAFREALEQADARGTTPIRQRSSRKPASVRFARRIR